MIYPPSAISYLRYLCLAGAAAIVFLLFYLGAQPFAVGLIPEPWDKLAHFLVFAILAGLLSIATAGKWPWLLIVAIGAIGALDEWHQSFLPGRSADSADFLTDLGAAICVVILYGCLSTRRTACGPRPCIRIC